MTGGGRIWGAACRRLSGQVVHLIDLGDLGFSVDFEQAQGGLLVCAPLHLRQLTTHHPVLCRLC